MRVVVDFGDVEAWARRAEAETDAIVGELKRAADMGAAFERASHKYQNRTHDLEDHTVAVIDQKTQSRVQVTLEMDMPYASFVVKRGLSEINTASVRVRDEFQDWADAMQLRIEG